MLKDTKANKVFLIILVVLLALGFTASRGWNVLTRNSRANQSIAFSTTDSLKVSTISNDIVIEVDNTAKGASVSIGKHESDLLSVSKTARSLNVDVKPKKSWFFRFFSYSPSAVVITLPAARLEELELSSISGNIRILHPIQGRSMQARSTSGELDFLTLTAEQDIKLSSISGTIKGSEVVSGQSVELASTSGGIEVQHVEARDAQLKSISGSVEAEVKILDGGSLNAGSTSGSVQIDLYQSSDLKIQASTTSGQILFNDKDMGKSAALETGNARNKVVLSTVSGGIELWY
jgi:DUF4097 and DUF4098 domain-containing protein YvlB